MEVKVIFGPPGTGKTTYLLNILEQELAHLSPQEIAYVSFTKEGAYQGRDRAIVKFGYAEKSFPYFRTLHSLAFRSLGMSRSQVINKKYYKMFSDKMEMHFTGYYTEEMRHNDDRYLFFNILHRNNPKVAADYLYDLDIQKLKFVSNNYKRFKDFYSIYDFTDMIELFNKENKALPVRVAIIDEAQDLTTLQWRMVWTAFKNCERIYIAGDDDQAIYEWSGADVNYFLSVEGKIEILRHSYRLPNNLVTFTKSITDCIVHRISKEYFGTQEEGTITQILDIREIKIKPEETWMFLSRNHVFLKEIEDYVRSHGLVYTYNGQLSVNLRSVEAINIFEKARRRGNFNQHEQIVLRPYLKRKVDMHHPWYENFDWSEEEKVYYRDLIRYKTDLNKCNVRINTIHSVKGAEADNVVVLMDITRQIYINLQKNSDSEYRVLYVGCTRAKKNLYIVESHSQYQYLIGRNYEKGRRKTRSRSVL